MTNGREDEVTRRDTQPNATQQMQTTERQRVEPIQEADLLIATRTARELLKKTFTMHSEH
jgi:hypothetical protein